MMDNIAPNPEIERTAAENYLLKSGRDFTATYMTVANLQYLARAYPETFVPRTVSALQQVLTTKTHRAQRQSYFLYRKAADALNGLIVCTSNSDMADLAGQALFSVLSQTQGPAFRAACEALGALPATLPKVETPCFSPCRVSEVTWAALMRKAGVKKAVRPTFRGRNILLPLNDSGGLLVVKTGGGEADIPLLANETAWMRYLQKKAASDKNISRLFHVPHPLEINGADVFFIKDAPVGDPEKQKAVRKRFAVAFATHEGYFTYPNEAVDHPLPGPDRMHAIIRRNAWLLGHLAGKGVIHTAPIPLFHNRVQTQRRTDGGLYEWHRGGRLDRWLESCRYPNLGETGIRDFEHFTVFCGPPRQLYYHIGSHIFSLVLIAGSYFRARAPHLSGLDQNGNPVDVRHLFDADLMHLLIDDILAHYFEGFTGTALDMPSPINIDTLTDRLIHEMGVDRHMTEMLRLADQQEMQECEFVAFLSQRGFNSAQIAQLKKGRADISIQTGPHLGDFNDRISLPELIAFTSAAAAMCIAGKYYSYSDSLSSAISSDKRFAL